MKKKDVYYKEKKMAYMLNVEKRRTNVSVVFDSIVGGYGY